MHGKRALTLPNGFMRISFLITVTIMLAAVLAGCSISNCAYYGSADANVRCVITGPSPTGGGH